MTKETNGDSRCSPAIRAGICATLSHTQLLQVVCNKLRICLLRLGLLALVLATTVNILLADCAACVQLPLSRGVAELLPFLSCNLPGSAHTTVFTFRPFWALHVNVWFLQMPVLVVAFDSIRRSQHT